MGYKAGTVPVDALLPTGYRQLLEAARVDVDCRQLAQIDSKDMDFAIWFELAQAVCDACADESVCGIVITHGTDTIEETAFFLAEVCRPAKPVVLTCAMRPATAISPDGPQNMLDAMSVALDGWARGVLVVASGAVHSASAVTKVHPYRTEAFSSGEVGPLAWVEEGRVRWVQQKSIVGINALGESNSVEAQLSVPCAPDALSVLLHLRKAGMPRVEWAVSRSGVNAQEVMRWLDGEHSEPVRGLILVCTGNGTFHQALVEPLRQAEQRGLLVWRSTRCTQGHIVAGLNSPDWPSATALDPVKARIALALHIARTDASMTEA